jgi:hypothetical protein
MAAWLAGAASKQQQDQQPQTLDQVKKRAQELQAPAPAPSTPPPPGPESAIPLSNLQKIIEQAEALKMKGGPKPVWTHVYNSSTGQIEAA